MIEPLMSDRALADDIDEPSDPRTLRLWWLGQSGYAVAWEPWRLVLDPYLSDSLTRKYAGTEKPHVRMSQRVIAPSLLGSIDFVTATHAHTDHLDAETLQALRAADEAAVLIAPRHERGIVRQRWGSTDDHVILMSDGESQVFGDVAVRAVAAAHDRIERDPDGNAKHLGYVIKVGPFTVYHAGDGVVYDGLAEAVRAWEPIDVAILPINGKVGNMNGTDAARLAEALGARLVVPCHYDMFEFNTADPAELFVPECERIGQPYRVLRLGERLTIEKETV